MGMGLTFFFSETSFGDYIMDKLVTYTMCFGFQRVVRYFYCCKFTPILFCFGVDTKSTFAYDCDYFNNHGPQTFVVDMVDCSSCFAPLSCSFFPAQQAAS